MLSLKQSDDIPPIHDTLAAALARYDHFIIDIWGVLHDGVKAYAGVPAALSAMKTAGKQLLLLSNSPNRASRVVEKVITPIGITPATYDHILTSGEAAYAHMRDHHAGSRVYTFWDEEEPTAIEGANLTRVYDVREADFIYASLIPYDAAASDYADVMALALSRRLPLVCGNPDRVVGHGDTLHVCVGTLAEAYERMGGPVIWIGKPYLPVYEQAWAMMGKPDKSKILAIGDSLVTDVAGAAGFGCDVYWNVTGIHWEELKSQHAAGRIDPVRVQAAIEGHATPTGLLHGFRL